MPPRPPALFGGADWEIFAILVHRVNSKSSLTKVVVLAPTNEGVERIK